MIIWLTAATGKVSQVLCTTYPLLGILTLWRFPPSGTIWLWATSTVAFHVSSIEVSPTTICGDWRLISKIRKFRWPDLGQYTHLFNEINNIIGTEKAWDVEFMRQFLSQPSCKPEENCYLAEVEGGRLIGFALVSPELPISRAVSSGGVLKAHRGQGIERELVRTSVEHSRSLGISTLHIEVPHDDTSARGMLESEGFQMVKGYWQMIWQGETSPPVVLPDGYSIRSFIAGEDEQVLTNLQNAAFRQNWGFSPNTVEEIRARTRMDRTSPEGIIFLVDGSKPSAYNWTYWVSGENGAIGWIAMTGVLPDYRGKGLGKVVVVAGMSYLKSKGVDKIELEVDSENATARELYLSLGFHKVHQTVWYENRLKD